jgi:poly-gamma-glutamate synthesis protein (capsule biosynthesis protein)
MYSFPESHAVHWRPVVAVFAQLLLCTIFLYGIDSTRLSDEPMRVVSSTPTFVHATEATDSVRILFVGDMFFDRQIRYVGQVQGPDYVFSCIDPLLANADFTVGNLEGPVTDNPSRSIGSIPGTANNYVFTFPTTTPMVLLRHHVGAVSIGNNHILNFGYDGLAQTDHYLTQAGLPYFGGVKGDEPVYRATIHGVPLSFVGYNQFGGSAPSVVA